MVNLKPRYSILDYLLLSILVGLPIVLFLLPASYFDEGQSVCISVLLLNKECVGCGLTRACMHLIHFDFTEAVYHNPLVLLVFPLGVMLWLRLLATTLLEKPLFGLRKEIQE